MINVGESEIDQLNTLLKLYEAGKDVKRTIINLLDKKKYGFVPDEQEAKAIKRISESPRFCRLKELIGNHESLNLVRVGIYIMELNDIGERQLINEIRNRVNKRYGHRGMKIINLGSTGTIFDVIDYLDTLKLRKGYGKEHIILEFNKILDNWERITIFVKSEQDEKSLYQNIQIYMRLKHPIFFVFAYGTACSVAMKTIADMNNARLITQKNHYLIWSKPGKDRAGKLKYAWNFELCPGGLSKFEFY